MELVIFVGLPASGKSTFFRTRLAGTHVLVSKDCFPNNSRPERRQRQLIDEALGRGQSVVVDNTNPTAEERRALIQQARGQGARVVGYYFQSRVADCLRRNRQRQGKDRVPDVAIFAIRKRLEVPTPAEGFAQLFFVRPVEDGSFEVETWKEETAGHAT